MKRQIISQKKNILGQSDIISFHNDNEQKNIEFFAIFSEFKFEFPAYYKNRDPPDFA